MCVYVKLFVFCYSVHHMGKMVKLSWPIGTACEASRLDPKHVNELKIKDAHVATLSERLARAS